MISEITTFEANHIRKLNKADAISPDQLNPFYKSLDNDPEFSKEIRDYVNEKLMVRERYLFVKKIGNVIHAKCSYCGNESTLKSVPKNQTFVNCGKCSSKLESRNTKHKKHRDSKYREFVHFDTSKISNDVIVGYQFSAYRTVEGEFENSLSIKDEIGEVAKYFFDNKSKNRVIDNKYGYSGEFSKSIFTVGTGYHGFCGHNKDSLIKAISKSDAFKYLPLSLIDTCYDMVKLLDLYAKYPQIEKLSKIGLDNLIEAKVGGAKTYGTINWSGKTIQKMLRLNKADIRKFVKIALEKGAYRNIEELFFMQQYAKNKIIGSEIDVAKQLAGYTNYDGFKRFLLADKPTRILKYIESQYEKDKKKKKNRIYYGMYAACSDFNDMLKDMKKLGIEINKSTIYPKNLNKHHVNLSKRVTQVISDEQKVKLMNRGVLLEKFCVSTENFVVIPVKTAEQLAEESNKLNHCVQTYTSKYANGRCNIFLVRKSQEKDEPFFTIETNKAMDLLQCRGKSNSDYQSNPDLKQFINQFIGNSKKILEVKNERIAN